MEDECTTRVSAAAAPRWCSSTDGRAIWSSGATRRASSREPRACSRSTSPATPEDRREQIRRQMLATPQAVIVGAGAAMFDPSLNGEDPIPVPVLVVLAPSPMWTPDYEAYVRRIAPRLEYRRVEGAGHFL